MSSSQQFMNSNSKTIAIDFDGTIVEHDFPRIGKEMLFAFATIKELNKKGHKLILWTYRTGDLLNEAVEYCRKNGVEFYAVNKNYPEEQMTEGTARKLIADIFIDDRNVGGFPGWSTVWNRIRSAARPWWVGMMWVNPVRARTTDSKR